MAEPETEPDEISVRAAEAAAEVTEARLAARAARSAFSLGPLLTGAAASAYINSRETRRLGQVVRRDLRHRALPENEVRLSRPG